MAASERSGPWRRVSWALAHRLPSGGTGRNAAWLLGGQLVGLTAALIATPIQLDRMGAERYGIVVISTATIASLLLVDAGAGWAVMRAVPWHRARGDHEHARRLAGSGLLLSAVAGSVAGGLLWLFSGDLVDVFKLSADLRPVAVQTFHVVAFILPLTLLYGVLAAVARSAGMFSLNAVVSTSVSVGMNIVWALVAGRDNDVVLVADAQLVLIASGLVVMLAVIHRRARDYLFPLRPGRRPAAELAAFGGKAAAGHASLTALANADKIGLAAILPVAVLPTYSIPFSVAIRITLGSSALSTVLMPRMAASSSVGDLEEARRLGLAALRVTALASATLAATFAFAGGAFLELWVDPGFADDAWGPLIALSIGFGALSTGSVGQTLLDASGRPGLNAALTGTGALVGLSLGLGLAAIFDTALAAAVGVAAGLCLIGAGSLELAGRVVLGISRRRLLAVVAVPWLTLSAAGALAFLASKAIAASPVVTILCVASAATAALAFAGLRQGALRGDAGH